TRRRGRPVSAPGVVRRDDDQRGRERRAALEWHAWPEAEHERRDRADDGEPGGERRAARLERVAEVAGVQELEGDSRDESDGDDERAEQAREDADPACEGERERQEAREPPGLRQRDGGGEGREDPRY